VTVFPAELLLEVCISDRLRACKKNDGTYSLKGTQRSLDEKRLKNIGDFITRKDSAFPNSIILAVNTRSSDGTIEDSDNTRWKVARTEDGDDYTLTIPSKEKLAAVIDGQHRLFSFAFAPGRLSMSLLCSVYFDLPKPFQAQLFATINSTQKQVNKNQTYELFGYNISDESEKFWSPDKLAVFFARRLNLEKSSPIRGRIVIAPEIDSELRLALNVGGWHVSMATIVEGILRLISSNPKQDANELYDFPEPKQRDVLTKSKRLDHSPLRNLYIAENDKLIFQIVLNYVSVCNDLFWEPAKENSFITKTVGVQALFDILKLIGDRILKDRDASVEKFKKVLACASEIDFTEEIFRSPSGSGRTAIRKAIQDAIVLD
jgi:DNA phosphorothioation-associated DGQHR protein 1